MTDTTDLAGMDPYDLLDAEAARVDAFLSTMPEEEWTTATRCTAWSRRDLLGHLDATEEYHHACLDDDVESLFGRYLERGVTDLDSANALGVTDRADQSAGELLARWRVADAQSARQRMRAADGTDMGSSVGPYPVRLQAFHVASELATHADDMDVPVTGAEAEDRLRWRARVTRFAIKETKPELGGDAVEGGTRLVVDATDQVVDDATLVDGFGGRLPDDADVDPAVRAAMSLTP